MIGGYVRIRIQKKTNHQLMISFVRTKGLEPPRLTTLDPKSSAATNYATCAMITSAKVVTFSQSCKYFALNRLFNVPHKCSKP